MASFQPSTNLRHAHASKTSTVVSTTSSLSSGIESHPSLGKWWCRNYGIGPRRTVKMLTRKGAEEHRFASVKFRTASGAAPISDLNFGGGARSSSSALVVASGPRVSLYGGANRTAGTSDFQRALKAGSAAQRRRQRLLEDDDDDDESVDLFGGKVPKKSDKSSSSDENLDDISADRNISTGGLLAECASHRSDGKLVAIGTEGGAVKICDAHSRATLRTFRSSNKQGGGGDRKSVRAAAWLRDGKRVVAGGDDAIVRVWNISGGIGNDNANGSGAGGADVTLRGHGDKVTSVKIVSFRKDDLPKSKKASKKRSYGNVTDPSTLDDSFDSPTWSQLVVSGSYDHTIRVWDIETPKGEDKCVSIMDHGDPVQALLVLPPIEKSYSGLDTNRSKSKKASKLDNLPLLVSAGGTTLKIWNPFNGSCLGTFPTKHAKTITSLCLLHISYDESEDDDNESNRRKRHIITGGLDGLLRIHSATNDDIAKGSLPYLHGMQIAHPISALALSPNMARLAIGTTTGIVMVHQRRRLASAIAAAAARKEQEEGRREPRHGTYSYFQRGAHEKSHDPDDYLLLHQKKQRLAEYDVFLRKFRYGDALDAVLAKRQPLAVIAVIEELGKRRGLTIALSNRDEETLDSILSFTIRFIDNPQYTSHLIGVAHILCDIYGSLRGQSAVVDELFAKLKEKVTNECSVQRMLLRLLGQIDYVMTTAEILNAEEQKRR
mmetsp:Transcript_11487/g.19896  ORF Transcript_11487/g.19896 Transcript_11487/m.19896 type:complete len:719 (-) Transcript_11487:2256-4412(-)